MIISPTPGIRYEVRMNRIDSTINAADSLVRRELENAQLLEQHFTEQKATLLRRAIPRCENEDRNGKACGYEASDVCVHCEQALCAECFGGPCPVASDHLPAKKAIADSVAKLADKIRMAG